MNKDDSYVIETEPSLSTILQILSKIVEGMEIIVRSEEDLKDVEDFIRNIRKMHKLLRYIPIRITIALSSYDVGLNHLYPHKKYYKPDEDGTKVYEALESMKTLFDEAVKPLLEILGINSLALISSIVERIDRSLNELYPKSEIISINIRRKDKRVLATIEIGSEGIHCLDDVDIERILNRIKEFLVNRGIKGVNSVKYSQAMRKAYEYVVLYGVTKCKLIIDSSHNNVIDAKCWC